MLDKFSKPGDTGTDVVLRLKSCHTYPIIIILLLFGLLLLYTPRHLFKLCVILKLSMKCFISTGSVP